VTVIRQFHFFHPLDQSSKLELEVQSSHQKLKSCRSPFQSKDQEKGQSRSRDCRSFPVQSRGGGEDDSIDSIIFSSPVEGEVTDILKSAVLTVLHSSVRKKTVTFSFV